MRDIHDVCWQCVNIIRISKRILGKEHHCKQYIVVHYLLEFFFYKCQIISLPNKQVTLCLIYIVICIFAGLYCVKWRHMSWWESTNEPCHKKKLKSEAWRCYQVITCYCMVIRMYLSLFMYNSPWCAFYFAILLYLNLHNLNLWMVKWYHLNELQNSVIKEKFKSIA
jgi:hypothetical protein